MAGVRFAVTTEAEVALSAATEKSVLQVRAPANQRVKVSEISISFDGTSNTNAPVEVEVRRTSADGTFTAATEQKLDESDDETIQTTGHYDASGEPTTKTAVLMGENIHPQGGYTWQARHGEEIEVIGGNALAVICTAPDAVNCWARMICEE